MRKLSAIQKFLHNQRGQARKTPHLRPSISYALSVLLYASRAIQRYVERIDQVLQENRKLKPVLITLTVKNGSDLAERSEHLMKSFRTLLERRRDYEKKGRGFNEFCKVQGAMYSYENTFNEKTVEWHPHIHMFALVDQWIDQQEFSEYWHSITGDSMVVDVRRAKKEKATATVKQLLKSVSTLLSSGICPLKRLGKPSRFSRVNA